MRLPAALGALAAVVLHVSSAAALAQSAPGAQEGAKAGDGTAGPAPAPTAEAQPAPAPAAAAADEWWKAINFGATLEGYYQYNANKPPDRITVLRAYDQRTNQFTLQQTAFVIDAAPDVSKNRRFGVRVDLQFGQATEMAQGSPASEPRPDAYRNVWQAFGSYIFPVGRGLRVDFGKFAANLGYETNYAKDNQAFSRALLFNFMPYYHSGARLTLPVSDKVSVMYALTNGIGQTEEFNNFKSHQVSATLLPSSKVTAVVNGYFGQEQPDNGEPDGPNGRYTIFDAYVAYTATPLLSVGMDVNHTSNQLTTGSPSLGLTGVGAYARYQLSAPVAAGLRYEFLDDEGLLAGLEQKVQEVTFTAEYKLADGVLVRGEYRRDWSNRDFFPGSRADEKKRAQNTVLAGVVFWLGNKQGAW